MAKRKLKVVRKALATIMAVSMVMSTTSISTFAETTEIATDSNAVKVEVSGDGTLESPQITTTTTTEVDPETGETLFTVDVENKADGTNADGDQISTENNEVGITIKDADGNVIVEAGSTEGSETTITETTDTKVLSDEKNVVVDDTTDSETGDQTTVTNPVTEDPTYTEWTESGTELGDWKVDEGKSTDGKAEVI